MSDARPASDCDMVLLVQAEFDGELDAAQAATVAAHRHDCAICRQAAQVLFETRTLLHDRLYEPAPEDVRRRIMARLDAARPAPPISPWRRMRAWWSAGVGFGIGATCAAALAWFVVAPSGPDLTRDIIAGHVRALQPGHLEDVLSSDRHTVKPWFDGRLDFAPPVKELAPAGFPLKGGRLDYLDGRAVAALIYQRDKHIIDLFVWPATAGSKNAPPQTAERHGYNVVHWEASGMKLWAVSDVEMSQLLDFAKAWQRTS